MAKEKRHRRRDSPERESKVKIKEEKVSPARPQTSRRSRSRSSSPQRRRTSRSPGKTRERSPKRGSGSPRNRRSPPRAGADVKIKRERDEHRAADGGAGGGACGGGAGGRRRRNDQPRRGAEPVGIGQTAGERARRRPTPRPRSALLSTSRATAAQRAAQGKPPAARGKPGARFRVADGGGDGADAPPVDKEKPDFGLSGALTEDTNTFRGVVIKYNEPAEARIPKRRWRLYPFKNDEPLPVMYVHRQSAYLLGRQRKIADIPIDHPSCSKQHAVFQYRLVPFTRADGTSGRRVRPYVIDLGSGNGTYLNNQRIESQRYYELKEKDVLKFGFSSREYVLLHETSDTSEVDVKQDEEDEEDEGLDE
ncbi:unnamed protein product [Pleuronectes platessa]|uniref:FHA domain-containing protein n=1 Tax=Pleuronectes platessa TaxID=8262 RepID=A0A9N7UDW8_PLEPL|nr:unnamed protein product [Pleuronectes platessa]